MKTEYDANIKLAEAVKTNNGWTVGANFSSVTTKRKVSLIKKILRFFGF